MIDIHKTLDMAEKEMQRLKDAPIVLRCRLVDMVSLVAVVQLALRHPGLPDRSKEIARQFIDNLAGLIGEVSPGLADFVRLGDKPEYDQPFKK